MFATLLFLCAAMQALPPTQTQNELLVQAGKKPAQVPFGHDRNILYAAFSPDGKRLAYSGEIVVKDVIRIWDIATQTEIQRISTNLYNSEYAFAPDGKSIAIGDLDGVSLVDVGPNPKARLILKSRFVPWVADLKRGTEVTSLHFSKDGKHLLVADFTGEITLIEVKTTKATCIREGIPGGPLLAHNCLVRLSPDGKRIAYTSQEGPIGLWDIAQKKRATVFNGHAGAVTSLQFSSDGEVLVSAGWDGTLRLWDCQKSKEMTKLQVGKQGDADDPCCGTLSPSNKEVATGDTRGVIKIWDLRTGKVIREMQGPRSGIMDLKYSPDGTFLVSTGEEHALRFWDAKTGGPIKK